MTNMRYTNLLTIAYQRTITTWVLHCVSHVPKFRGKMVCGPWIHIPRIVKWLRGKTCWCNISSEHCWDWRTRSARTIWIEGCCIWENWWVIIQVCPVIAIKGNMTGFPTNLTLRSGVIVTWLARLKRRSGIGRLPNKHRKLFGRGCGEWLYWVVWCEYGKELGICGCLG